MWGTDVNGGFSFHDEQVGIFAMVHHATAECLGLHLAKCGSQFAALKSVRRAVHEQFGAFHQGIALGLRLRHDHGAQFLSDDFQREIGLRDIESSPAFIREPEGNGCIERFLRTLNEQLLWAPDFDTLEEPAGALRESRRRYNQHWLVERLNFQSPRQARQRLLALEAAA